MIGLRRNLFGISNRPSSLPSHVRVDVVQGTTCSAARWHKNGLYFQFTWCLTPPPFPHPTTKYSCSAMSAGRKKRDSERESLMKLGTRNVNKEGRRRSRWKGSVGGEKEAVEGTSTVRKSRREVEREEVWEEEWVKSERGGGVEGEENWGGGEEWGGKELRGKVFG